MDGDLSLWGILLTAPVRASCAGTIVRYATPLERACRGGTVRELLDAMPDKEFQRITRSTLALLAWWREPSRVARFVSLLGLPLPPTSIARFEYPVACSLRPGTE